MSRQFKTAGTLVTLVAWCLSGCAPSQPFFFFEDKDPSHYIGMATKIEYPDVEAASLAEVQDTPPPLTLDNTNFDQTWNLTLQDAVKYSLENSKVMRTLGGGRSFAGNTSINVPAAVPDTLTSSPQSVPTIYDPAINESGQTGAEQALAPYDAVLTSTLNYQHNDEPQNIQSTIGAPQVLQQELATYQTAISKRTMTGGLVSVTSNTTYDNSNNFGRQIPRDYTTNIEVAARQPLLAGAGLQFNRIAGPFDQFIGPNNNGNFNGVVLARLNTDITLAQFETGVRNLVADVENAYWQLNFSYRGVEAEKKGRDSALITWRKVHILYVAGARGGEAEKEAEAREQYFLFRSQLQSALSNLYKAENRLRYMMGLAPTDGRLIRPIDEPTTARVKFDWREIHAEALARSVELRQQKWTIKQRELELIAARNMVLPRLDAVALYRFLGEGQDLFGPDNPTDPSRPLANSSATTQLFDGNFQEWQLGFNFSMPLGFRRELAQVRNQELLLARERARLQDQELEVSHQVSDAIRDLDANYELSQTEFNRLIAAIQEVKAVDAAYQAGTVTLDLLLNAQRIEAEDQSAYYASLADYNRSIAQVHFRKGSLLEYNGVYLAEGPWPAKAYFDAEKRARERDAGFYLDYGYTRPNVLSRGAYPQNTGDAGESATTPTDGNPTPAKPENIHSPGPTDDVGAPMHNNGNEQASVRSVKSAASTPRRSTDQGVQQAGFNWSDVGLDASGSQPATAAGRTAQWKTVDSDTTNEPVATNSPVEADRPAPSWKRAQR